MHRRALPLPSQTPLQESLSFKLVCIGVRMYEVLLACNPMVWDLVPHCSSACLPPCCLCPCMLHAHNIGEGECMEPAHGNWHGLQDGASAELALYGRADHMSFTAELTLRDRTTMAMRATYLITIFLPFILLGPVLLLLADLLLKWSRDSAVRINGHR